MLANTQIKIALTSDHHLKSRRAHLFNTMHKHGIEIINHDDASTTPDADIWIIEYLYKTANYVEDNIKRFNEISAVAEKYKGKVLLMCLNDGCPLYAWRLPKSLIDRINGIITASKNSTNTNLIDEKIVLIPQFTIDYTPFKRNNIQKNKSFFIGKMTGGSRFNGKNWRVESFKLIKQANLIPEYFEGWLYSNTAFFDHKLKNDVDYINTIVCIQDKLLSQEDYLIQLQTYQTSLCLPGNVAWCYRHLQSAAYKNTIISYELSSVTEKWLFQDVFNDSFYFLKPDLSNLCDIIKYAADNVEESIFRAEQSYAAYSTYWELLPDNTYQDHVWRGIMNSFEKIGISL
jgi:hypothetical protein